MKVKRVCVFCGSSRGTNPSYVKAAADLGREMLKRNSVLVYGGGSVGLMGELARTVSEGGGEVVGFIPEALQDREVSGGLIGNTRVVSTMHERKAAMHAEADAFIALPGGFGTLEELLEMITWQQLGYHKKPVGILNIEGYFDSLLQFFDHAVQEGFIREAYRQIPISATDPVQLFDAFESFQAVDSYQDVVRGEDRSGA